MKRTRPPDIVAIIEAAYAIDRSPRDWMMGLLTTIEAQFGEGLGAWGTLYETVAGGFATADPASEVCLGLPDDVQKIVRGTFGRLPTELIRRTLRTSACGLSSETPQAWRVNGPQLAPYGIRDGLNLNAYDLSGTGCLLSIALNRRRVVTSETRALLVRAARHLASAVRLRKRIADSSENLGRVEAVMDVTGTIEHAEGAARDRRAHLALHNAVCAIERARDRSRPVGQEDAINDWKGLVSGRWTLVDVFRAGDRRFIVARENEPTIYASRVLSPRELQVLSYVAVGYSNKEIAYELGISHSTVRVTIAHAAGKLGVSSRAALQPIADELWRKAHAAAERVQPSAGLRPSPSVHKP